jgi:hypothetical protein
MQVRSDVRFGLHESLGFAEMPVMPVQDAGFIAAVNRHTQLSTARLAWVRACR